MIKRYTNLGITLLTLLYFSTSDTEVSLKLTDVNKYDVERQEIETLIGSEFHVSHGTVSGNIHNEKSEKQRSSCA